MTAPVFRAPQLATLVDDVVEGDGWIFERKLDGIRMIVVRDGEEVRLLTRNRKDHTSRYPEITEALTSQPCHRFVLDGEVVAFDGNLTSFARLQRRSGLEDPDQARATGIAVHLYAFDLLHREGEDLVELPLRERKSLLRRTLDYDDPIRFCSHRDAEGPRFLDEACRKGWEGLIAKRADRHYRSGRSRDWLKLKCVARQELVIGGYTDPTGSRSRFGALLVGFHSGDALVYAGRVGTGFDEATLESLGRELARRERSTSPFEEPPDADGVHWVRPDLVAEIGFTEWTRAGRLRHPRFLGLRADKDARDVVREEPEPNP